MSSLATLLASIPLDAKSTALLAARLLPQMTAEEKEALTVAALSILFHGINEVAYENIHQAGVEVIEALVQQVQARETKKLELCGRYRNKYNGDTFLVYDSDVRPDEMRVSGPIDHTMSLAEVKFCISSGLWIREPTHA